MTINLTSLSILGNYPNLMELWLVGNHLDLSDAGIKATLSNFTNLIQTNRANQGWGGWYSDAVEVEPQLPKSFQNLTSEMARVQNANDPQSNLLKGIHALLHIVESTEATALKEFVVSIGVDSSIRQFTLSDLPMLENYSHTLNRDFNSGKLAELFQNSIIPSLEQVDSHFAKIPSGQRNHPDSGSHRDRGTGYGRLRRRSSPALHRQTDGYLCLHAVRLRLGLECRLHR